VTGYEYWNRISELRKEALRSIAKCGPRVTGQVWECALGDLCKLDDAIPYTLTEKGRNAR